MAGGGAAAKWFLKKGKNDGKGSGILWESEPLQQQLLPLLEAIILSARVCPQPIPASVEQPWPREWLRTLTEAEEATLLSTPAQLSLQLALALEFTSTCWGWGVPASSW